MIPTRWPEYLNAVYAKSKDRGGETLAQHTWQVLRRLADLYRLRPNLTEVAQTPKMWHLLFWTCLLHDFGKATSGFQHMLATNGKERWPHRHEVISLIGFDWIASNFSEREQRAIVAAIASHHKDASEIGRSYRQSPDPVDPDPIAPPLAELSPDTASLLWRWVDDLAEPWMRELGFPVTIVQPLSLMPHDQAMTQFQQQGTARIHHWLKQYLRWVRELEDPSPVERLLPILLRGLTTTADHLASSNLAVRLDPIQESWQHLATRLLKPSDTPYLHQEASATYHGESALLISPTGSGKTEAALYWALGEGDHAIARIFYALPYQASMNAMHQRLQREDKGFGAEAVGLQHGRAVQALYARFAEQAPADESVSLAKLHHNINNLHARPIKVFSPYQMLKAAFQLRGFEGMLTDYAQASFIFDEIHAYEPKRLALILEMMRYLRIHYQSRFFVMSATFPKHIRARLADALAISDHHTVRANDDIFQKFSRHQLHLVDGDLLSIGVERIIHDVQMGKQVLACANTVKSAQQLYHTLHMGGLSREQMVLIHSRYTMRDRIRLEQEVMRRCELGLQHPEPFVLIATQVVEVSLNIDLDTIYTDPAPLEALLQRFGRVNRSRTKGICPVHVFRQPNDGQYVYGRHQDKSKQGHIIRVTLAELEQHEGQKIDEAQIENWLNAIYADPLLQQQWEEEYRETVLSFTDVLNGLKPFNSNEQTEAQFEAMFDNIEVLPKCFEKDYLDLIAQGSFIEASQFFVSISTQKYKELRRKGKVHEMEASPQKKQPWMVSLPYSKTLGLQFDDDGSVDYD
jgi:CRISPR-associated endonuclease/helicase Cas3